jgi:hypothetical protein
MRAIRNRGARAPLSRSRTFGETIVIALFSRVVVTRSDAFLHGICPYKERPWWYQQASTLADGPEIQGRAVLRRHGQVGRPLPHVELM